jgi:hypothetical protein
MMEKKIPEVRSVLVDVAVHDKNGDVISDDLLSSGGARRPNGSLITHYSNPRIPEPAPTETAAERNFDETLQRESQARRRREGEAAEAARERLLNEVSAGVNSFLEQVVYPKVNLWWKTRGPDDLKRAGRWLAARLRRDRAVEAPLPSQGPATEGPQASSEDASRAVEQPAAAIADIVQIDEYRDRRSA